MAIGIVAIGSLLFGVPFVIQQRLLLGVVTRTVPLARWLEGIRRALLGAPTPQIPGGFTDSAVLLALCATTALRTLGSWAVYRTFEHVARERGLIDQATGS